MTWGCRAVNVGGQGPWDHTGAPVAPSAWCPVCLGTSGRLLPRLDPNTEQVGPHGEARQDQGRLMLGYFASGRAGGCPAHVEMLHV